MGSVTSGFAVLNLSSYTLRIGLSMGATHYSENKVKHGEIFYRRPGAVWYTVFAQTAPVAVTVTGAHPNDVKLKQAFDVLAALDAADVYAEMKGCYGGISGTWLVLRGGLQLVNGEVKHEKLSLEEKVPEFVLGNGMFTSYSYDKFYTTAKAKKHSAAGHSCRRTACKLL